MGIAMNRSQRMGLTLCMVIGLVNTARANDEAGAVIDKAIKAAGGAENLAKMKAQTWKEKGTYYGMGNGLPYSGVYAIQFPGQFRMEIQGIFTIVVDGDKGWVKAGENAMDMEKEQIDEYRESNHAGHLTMLLPLKSKKYTLTSTGETKVNNLTAVGVKISHAGHRDVTLYFDKETGLLVKSATKVKDMEGSKEMVDQESFLSNHKEVDGVKVPMKLVIKRQGKLYLEAENEDVKLVGKLDAKVFAKP
jgi:outer membrane lipoprotein-sorting protein